jgi:hypothetical protein
MWFGDPSSGYALAPNSGTRDPATGSNRTCENGESIIRRSAFGGGVRVMVLMLGWTVPDWSASFQRRQVPAHVQPNLVAKELQ